MLLCLLRALQPDICGDEGLWVLETSDRFVYAQSESPQDSLQDGDSPVCASVCAERRLDGFHRLEGCLLANPHTSGQSQVSQIRSFESSISVQSSVLRSLYGSSGFTRVMAPVSAFLHRLGIQMCRYLDDWLLQASSCLLALQALETLIRLCQDVGIVINWEKSKSHSIAESGILRCDSLLHSFQGFSLPAESREAMLKRRRILVLRHTACLFMDKAVRNSVISDINCSGGKVTDAIPSASPSPSMESEGRLHLDSLGSRVSFGMVDGSEQSSVRQLPSSGQPSPRLLV